MWTRKVQGGWRWISSLAFGIFSRYLGFYPEIIWPHKAGCLNSNDNIAIPLEKTKGLNDSDNIHSHLLNIQNPISFPMHVILSHNTYLTDLTCYEINKSPLCQKKKRASSLNPLAKVFTPLNDVSVKKLPLVGKGNQRMTIFPILILSLRYRKRLGFQLLKLIIP